MGSHLTDALVSRGDTVLGIDNMRNGYEENKNPKAQYLKEDINHVLGKIHDFKPDLVFHLACYPRSISFRNPYADLMTNYYSTIQLCEVAKHDKCGIVYSSNSGLLGPPVYLPYDERHPVHPLTPYDNHKFASENLLRLYTDNFGVRSYILRFSSVYGPRQRPNPKLGWMPLIPTWINALIRNMPVRLEGDGEQTRDFIYVDDVVRALLKAGDVLRWANGAVGPYLLASGKETGISDLLDMLGKLIPSQSKVEYAPAKLGDIRRMAYDNSAVRLALNWKPEIALDVGLKRTVDWWLKRA